jgi:hypothetical protein
VPYYLLVVSVYSWTVIYDRASCSPMGFHGLLYYGAVFGNGQDSEGSFSQLYDRPHWTRNFI